MRLGQIQKADTVFEKAQDLFESHSIVITKALGATAHLGLGIIRTIQGRYDEAIELGQASVAYGETNDNKQILPVGIMF